MKSFKLEEFKKIAVQSYELGKIGYSMVKYDDWLNKIVKNYGTDRN
jgi:hypothetical protein